MEVNRYSLVDLNLQTRKVMRSSPGRAGLFEGKAEVAAYLTPVGIER